MSHLLRGRESAVLILQEKSIHHDFIKSAIPEWFTQARLHRVSALKAALSPLPEWNKTASFIEHDRLMRATEESWRAQNNVDRMLDELQDVYSFAEPLLSQALKEQYAVDVDARETFLKLFSPVKTSPWVADVTGGVGSRTVSLLDAAIHNFSIGEVLLADSQFISRPDKFGRFEIKDIRNKISIEQYKSLCRTLDIGARYQQHIEGFLRPVDGVARGALERNITKSQKTALKAALYLAMMKKDITRDGYLAVQGLLQEKAVNAGGLPYRYYHLTMMEVQLKGIVLIATDLETFHSGNQRVIAYVPHDPEHPVKEYSSAIEFSRELTRQLRGRVPTAAGISYQQFFSRFVDHQQRGHFFATLNLRLVEITRHEKEPGVGLPAWRETPVENPRLHFGTLRFEDDRDTRFKGALWVYLYQQQQNKILNDARELAISTDYADRMERWAWFDNLEKIISDIFNVVLMVVTPFVPGLGEVMMVYMAFQLVSELVEGVIDLAEGLYLEGTEHLIGFTESLIQLGTFAAGMKIGTEVVLPKLSSFIESSKVVTLADGSQRLWGQDLEPYRKKNLTLGADSRPDDRWLHQHEGKLILNLDSRYYELRKDPQSAKHRVQHPSRLDAYQPAVEGNGAGAFVIEGEQPHLWSDDTLMVRLGAPIDGLSDAYADIRTVSRTDAAAIRRMYVGNERPLPLLRDTVTRFRIDRDIRTLIEQLGSDQPHVYLKADPALQFQVLQDLWTGKAMELSNSNGDVIGSLGDSSMRPIRIDAKRLTDGDLLKTLLSHLDEGEIKTLMNNEFGAPNLSFDAQAVRLRAMLVKQANRRRTSLFDRRYREFERHWNVDVQRVRGLVPDLPGSVAQEVWALATRSERLVIAQGQLPVRLKNFSLWGLQEVRVSRAYEGLYLDSVDNPDTRSLIMHSLEELPGWNHGVRIEVVRFEYGGRVLDIIGRDDATIRRTLVEREDSTYQAYDDEGNTLHAPCDLHSSLLHALPDAERSRLNINIGEGRKLEQALSARALKPYRLLKVLADLPVLDRLTYDPQLMRLRGGAPTVAGEVAGLLEIQGFYANDLVAGAFDPAASQVEKYNYLRGLKLMHESFLDGDLLALRNALFDANTAGDLDANLRTVQSIEVLPDLKKLMLDEQFDALVGRLFGEQGLVPLTESERNLGINARNLEQTGFTVEYQSLLRTVRDNTGQPSPALADLRTYGEDLFTDVTATDVPIEVTAQTLADLQMAQRAIYRAKELLPLSGNQLPSIWEKGGSAIAKIKGLREMNLEEGGFTARLTIAEAARKAIDIKGGNCSENSKVTFSILASQPRSSKIHIVNATESDHQYVVIGDDISKPEQLVVADSWPEFPAAHLACKGYFSFSLPVVATLEPGPAIAEYAFINEAPAGLATTPAASEANTFRQIKINKLYKSGAYAQFTSLKELGTTYTTSEGVPVSFELLPAPVIQGRIEAYRGYREAFKDLFQVTEDAE